MPDFERERQHGGLVAGVDEAGRGPLAGPVVAAAVILDPTVLPRELLAVIDDSKALKAGRREAISIALLERARAGTGVMAAIAAASTTEIEELNILQASLLAMRRAVMRLPLVPDLVLVDGNKLPAGLPCDGETVIGGDARCLSIAAASILAKVMRDRIMHRLDLRYPGYRWTQNAGYGTADHRSAILELGPTRHHRNSFCRKIFQ